MYSCNISDLDSNNHALFLYVTKMLKGNFCTTKSNIFVTCLIGMWNIPEMLFDVT